MQEQKCATPIFPEQTVNDLSSFGLQVQKSNWNLKIKAIDSANFFVTKLNAKKKEIQYSRTWHMRNVKGIRKK